MAKDQSRRIADEQGRSGRSRSENGRKGSHSNTKHRTPAAVRRQRALEEDPRLRRAREERERAERQLAALEQQVNGQPHTPYRLIEEKPPVVDTPEEKTPVQETKPAPISWTEDDARNLIAQGYHVARVVQLTGVPVEKLKGLVGADGYARGL